MARLTKIYTRTGDDGTTGLADGRRVGKDDAQVEAYGTVDELNSALGLALALGLSSDVAASLTRIQSELLNLGGELSMLGSGGRRPPRALIEPRHIEQLEAECDRFNAELGALANFILPGGTTGASQLHLARTICRRAERRTVTLAHATEVAPALVQYLNRLSDLLFIVARYENKVRGAGDVLWDTRV
ncbi:MAG: cob(I)yrinic acid a,c-diamide adenosyltransferase [Acidobacteria bacterium]|jgi:cob(I)alamin adenosyltransferase|nr:cob(I)yrinic acid a,c-diamide adenosyltransferase [Acidobacteriota bacterium]